MDEKMKEYFAVRSEIKDLLVQIEAKKCRIEKMFGWEKVRKKGYYCLRNHTYKLELYTPMYDGHKVLGAELFHHESTTYVLLGLWFVMVRVGRESWKYVK